jgi:chitin synthase
MRFDQLKTAMKNVGLSKRNVAQTCQLLAAILHLGNLDFTIDRSRNEDAAVVRNLDVLQIVSEFLGVRSAALEAVLSYKTKLVKKELATVFLDPDGAADNRDDLAKALYSLLFAWLNEHINQKMCKDDFTTLLGLVDLPGPQNMTSRPNSLDQFCINFANERLHHFTQKRIFESHTAEYTNEGINELVPKVAYFDNSECIRLLQNMPGGMIHIMDDQARRQPKKNDHTMVEAFTKRWGNHSSFKTGPMDRSGYPTFTVSHYHGPVNYSAEAFLERNLEAINPDFISLLRGVGQELGDDSGSINPFVKGLFSTKAIATQVHPRDEETIVSAQQPVKPMRTPSTRRKGTVRGRRQASTGLGDIDEKGAADEDDDVPASSDGGVPCVAGEFRNALNTLFETLEEAQAWFVFCINPNDSQLPNQLEGRSVKGQVRSAGLSEVAKRAAVVLEVGMTPREFVDRYREPLAAVGVVEGEPRELVEQAQTALGLQRQDIVQGREKVRGSYLIDQGGADRLSRSSCRKPLSIGWRTTCELKIPRRSNATACAMPKLPLVWILATSRIPLRLTQRPAQKCLTRLMMVALAILSLDRVSSFPLWPMLLPCIARACTKMSTTTTSQYAARTSTSGHV